LSGVGFKNKFKISSVRSAGVLDTARFVVRLLGLFANEPRFCVWVGLKFPGLLCGLLCVLSKLWGSFLITNAHIDGKVGSLRRNHGQSFLFGRLFTKISSRSPHVRRLILMREMRINKRFGGVRTMIKEIGYSGTNVRANFAVKGSFQKSSGGVGVGNKKKNPKKLGVFELRQKIRRFWGNLTRQQLWQYRKRASLRLRGLWERYALGLFECRLDVFLVRSNFLRNVNVARCYIRAGFVFVNAKVITHYRYAVGEGDLVRLCVNALSKTQLLFIRELWYSLIEEQTTYHRVVPNYLEISFKRLATCFILGRFKILNLPQLIKFNTIFSLNCGRFNF
jgi:ribosomal protein S4